MSVVARQATSKAKTKMAFCNARARALHSQNRRNYVGYPTLELGSGFGLQRMVITPAYYRRWAARFAQMARRAPDDHTAEELAQLAARLRALAKHSANQRIKRSYLLERARLTAPARKRSAAQRDASAGPL